MSDSLQIASSRVLLPDGTFCPAELTVRHGRIESVNPLSARHGAGAQNLLLLPGIVDLHGDAFERQIMPRPGVSFGIDVALADTDRQLVANGITTAFHAVTYSWEPGLRGRDTLHALMDALENLGPRLACDTRLHLRYETFNFDAEAEVTAWIDARRIALLAFNDHTPAMVAKADDPKALAKYADRANMAVDAFRALLHRVHARRDEVPAGIERLAVCACDVGIPLASHDDETPSMRTWFHERGCAISEFPKTEPTARAARELGNDVVMGAPNVVRGGSHLSAVSASSLVRDRLCTILTSDYYYPALLHAAFRLSRDGILPLADAWRLISVNPAAAAGLRDRGEIAPGHRADFILVDDSDPILPRVAATFVAGRPVFLDDRPARAA